MSASLSSTTCSRCFAAIRRGTRFCGECGTDLVGGEGALELVELDDGGPRQPRSEVIRRKAGVAALGLALLLSLASFAGYGRGGDATLEREIRSLQGEVERLGGRSDGLDAQNAKLAGRLKSTESRVKRSNAGVAPLAKQVLKSVFTVEVGASLGTAFAAWQEDGVLFLVTADHVVDGAARPYVAIERDGGSWSGEIVRRDRKNDLALIRLSGRPPKTRPLWQGARRALPATGDELLLVGSPFGLGGTVTSGVVSRVSKRVIQTDAAANPGNSGGPAIDREGRVVGVLVAGGGQNINFVVPIARACARLRACT
jgi:S1-C subfamily serine protease